MNEALLAGSSLSLSCSHGQFVPAAWQLNIETACNKKFFRVSALAALIQICPKNKQSIKS
jgi:hypothetical protein